MANNGHKRSQRCAATYSELLCLIDNNALALVNSGLTRGAPIAVCQEPSIESVASFLAILQVGGVYVPL